LFGIRKKLEKIEQDAAEVVKEGEELVEKEIRTAEKEIESAAVAVEAEAEAAGAGFLIAGDLIQAGAVAGAEAVGLLVGLSVVNGILTPESQK
jgi:predicted RNA-binding protein with PUA domain